MLLAHGIVVSGLPLPVGSQPPATGSPAARRLATKDRARPFPCMDKSCGCSTAEQCFARCCCNSPADLLAWAKSHGLEPATLAALERRVIAVGTIESVASCCETASCDAAPATGGAAAGPDVCDEYRSLAAQPTVESPHDTEPSVDRAARPDTGIGMVSFTAMLACEGVLEGFVAATTALPPPSLGSPVPAMPLVATLLIADDASSSVVLASDTPPPRS